jgi:hypothetical protein
MREIRTSGSEGGGIEANRCFLPLYLLQGHPPSRRLDSQPIPKIGLSSLGRRSSTNAWTFTRGAKSQKLNGLNTFGMPGLP